MQISSSMEDYLETIHLLEQRQGNVRVKDIALEMDITMPSVSGAIKNLEKHGFVAHPRYDLIALTSKGAKIAEAIYKRHRIIKSFLIKVLEVDESIAEKDACKIEHAISSVTLDRLSQFINTVARGESWKR